MEQLTTAFWWYKFNMTLSSVFLVFSLIGLVSTILSALIEDYSKKRKRKIIILIIMSAIIIIISITSLCVNSWNWYNKTVIEFARQIDNGNIKLPNNLLLKQFNDILYEIKNILGDYYGK
jgi:predicted PurR-regulated permease PerM